MYVSEPVRVRRPERKQLPHPPPPEDHCYYYHHSRIIIILSKVANVVLKK